MTHSEINFLPVTNLKDFKLIFWDFDGVIKDSVSAKSDAFELLFLPFGRELASRVRSHHELNGGVSRFKKIPTYLSWVDVSPADCTVTDYCDKFSKLVIDAVIQSPNVPGVFNYIKANQFNQLFVLVTATPIDEIKTILKSLEICDLFADIFGSPDEKYQCIAQTLEKYSIKPEQALMIGDSLSDYQASTRSGVKFMLRRTPLNISLQNSPNYLSFDDLTNE